MRIFFSADAGIEDYSVMGDEDGESIPLPLDHFFFCLPAGAYLIISIIVGDYIFR
jgi:hypothetical protein